MSRRSVGHRVPSVQVIERDVVIRAQFFDHFELDESAAPRREGATLPVTRHGVDLLVRGGAVATLPDSAATQRHPALVAKRTRDGQSKKPHGDGDPGVTMPLGWAV